MQNESKDNSGLASNHDFIFFFYVVDRHCKKIAKLEPLPLKCTNTHKLKTLKEAMVSNFDLKADCANCALITFKGNADQSTLNGVLNNKKALHIE